jgi:dipeptidyl-peptidase III
LEIAGLSATLRILKGDHSEELEKICSSMAEARKHAANENQRLFLSQYIESFQSGELEIYRESQRSWIKDRGPRVENIFGFVEPYRDPYGTRAEFEGLVGINDVEETMALNRLVEESDTFIRRLPWAGNGTTASNNGKGPFEKALFDPPDISSLHSKS